jgi:hypothetical protein
MSLNIVRAVGLLLLITACGAAKPAATVPSATATATPISTSAPSAPSQSCHDLIAANPSVDPSRVPKQWNVYTNAAGVKTIIPSGWSEVSGNFIVSATDPALGHPNNLSLSVFHHQGEVPSAETIVIAEGADLSRSHPDLLGVPEGKAVTLPTGRAARLSYCLPKKESDGTPVTLAFLQLLIARPAGSGAYDVYLLQMIAPVTEMGYYGVVFELAAKALVLP